MSTSNLTGQLSNLNPFSKIGRDVLACTSYFAPIIIFFCVLFFSILTKTLPKAFFYLFWVFVLTLCRILLPSSSPVPSTCFKQLIPSDITYTTFISCFTLVYFLGPLIMVSKQNKINDINYGMIAFFVAFIVLDLFIKQQTNCIPNLFTQSVILSVVLGLGLGALISCVFMYSLLKQYLYINEINSSYEVCSRPSKQQFRCTLPDGSLVASTFA